MWSESGNAIKAGQNYRDASWLRVIQWIWRLLDIFSCENGYFLLSARLFSEFFESFYSLIQVCTNSS